MILKDYLPAPPLRELVQCYRIVHFESDKGNEWLLKAYPPKPETCLHFILKGKLEIELIDQVSGTQPLSISLLGQQTAVTTRYNSGNLLNFQVVLQPSAIFRLTGIPASEITNKCIDAGFAFPGIHQVFEEMQEAKTYGELLAIGERFMVWQLNQARREKHVLDALSNLMMNNDENISLDWLANQSCLCTKQFKRKFQERVGVNPKTYQKIIRIVHAYNTKNAKPHWDWLKIALECNYFDYQHLAKDYKSFTYLTPNEFHEQERNSPECKLGLADDLYRLRYRSASCSP